jgi:Ulp1 family protease
VDEESCIGALTYHDIYKYKNNLYTGDEVVSGFYYLLDSKFGGGENKFFGTGFFTTCVQDFSIERKLTQFKKKFRTEWKKLFFPVNAHSNHWILLTADVDEKTVKVYDSLGKSNETYTHLLLNIINQVKKKDEQWVVVDNTTANIQRQMDLVNCGWFTCWYAYQIATNNSVAKWLGSNYEKEVRAIKKNIMLSLVDKKIFSKGGK